MSGRKHTGWISYLFKASVIVVTAVSRVAASVVPSGPNEKIADLDTWNALRDDFKTPTEPRALPADVVDVVEAANLDDDLRHSVVLSFALVREEDIAVLDDFWVETIVSRGDSDVMERFISMRSHLRFEANQGDGAYMDWYLWQAKGGGGGGCDDVAA